MCTFFTDWRACRLTACQHDKQGGFAFNTPSVIVRQWWCSGAMDQGSLEKAQPSSHKNIQSPAGKVLHDQPKYNVDESSVDYWTSCLAHCLERFAGCYLAYHWAPYPFRFERFTTDDLHPVSSSPFPWS